MKSTLWERSNPSLDSSCRTTSCKEEKVVLGFVWRRRDSRACARSWSDIIVGPSLTRSYVCIGNSYSYIVVVVFTTTPSLQLTEINQLLPFSLFLSLLLPFSLVHSLLLFLSWTQRILRFHFSASSRELFLISSVDDP